MAVTATRLVQIVTGATVLIGLMANSDRSEQIVPKRRDEPPLIVPIPFRLQTRGVCQLKEPFEVAAPPELELPAQLLKRELATFFGSRSLGKGGTLISFQTDRAKGLSEERYALSIDSNTVVMKTGGLLGAYWAVHSLLQVLKSSQLRRTIKGWSVPRITVDDSPASSFRAFMIQGAWAGEAESLKAFVRLLASLKVRAFALEFGPQIVLDLDRSIAQGKRWSKKEAKEIVDYGRRLGMEPIAYLNLLAHLERAYRKKEYCTETGLRINDPQVYQSFVFPIVEEMLEVFGEVKFFHCGMDEANDLFAQLHREGYDAAALLAGHISKIADFLSRRNVRLVIWHDMLFSPEWERIIGGPIGPANGGPPYHTWRALDLIPKNVIINYWFYEPEEKYPAIDWLKAKGFEVWASPWHSPFPLVTYSMHRQVPTMGTIWSDPPGCLAGHTFAVVPALYAQAAWNPGVAPPSVPPELALKEGLQRKTLEILWGRSTATFPAPLAVLVQPATGRRRGLRYPEDLSGSLEQYFGVPFDFSQPHRVRPLRGTIAEMGDFSSAAAVRTADGRIVPINGINRSRDTDQLILYWAPLRSSGTNIYGAEVAVSSDGTVLATSAYGQGDMPIPKGGCVLSAHLGPKGENYEFLTRLRVGDRLAFLDGWGNYIGGGALLSLIARLPNGDELTVDGWDRDRGEGDLVLYQPGYGSGRTGTNQWGVEVSVEKGRVRHVVANQGDSSIPKDGFVLSAHWGPSGQKAEKLSQLKVGDRVELFLLKGRDRYRWDGIRTERTWLLPVNQKVRTLFASVATEGSSLVGHSLGQWTVTYQDGASVTLPIRLGREGGSDQPLPLPLLIGTNSWLCYRAGESVPTLIFSWENPYPDKPVASFSFRPSILAVDQGFQIRSLTLASESGHR